MYAFSTGFPGRNEGVRDAAVVSPEVQGLTRELWAVVGGDRLRCTSEFHGSIQGSDDIMSRD